VVAKDAVSKPVRDHLGQFKRRAAAAGEVQEPERLTVKT
jgi:hypothetical protein